MNQTGITKELIDKAYAWACKETERYGSPPLLLTDAGRVHARDLASRFGVDPDLLDLSMLLMDIKLGEALHEKKMHEHVKRSSVASKEFLEAHHVPECTIKKIIGCIESHHQTKDWPSKEAEIAANADCYKFLVVRYLLQYIPLIAAREGGFDAAIDFAQKKVEEKWAILSLDTCKKELEPDYRLIKTIITRARAKSPADPR